jgi:hypothetical protein
MNLQEDYSKITQSDEFKEFKKNNSDSFLSSIFLDTTGWQFNFYSKKIMISFFIEGNIIKTEESEIYEKDSKIEELKLEELKIDLNEAEELIKKTLDEKVTKKIIILQQKEVPFWNITYITASLNVSNIWINAISGEIIKQKTENILNFKSHQ